jgi:hypothetical protein
VPYVSEAQRRYMHAKHPKIAARWDREYPSQGKLPQHKRKKRLKDYLSR